MFSYRLREELKWVFIGLAAGFLAGYVQGSGMVDFLSLLPI
ncbi:MAG: hypothetical protein ABEI07_02100 [Candidatus Nanohaloarchaea archaeon]